MRPLDYDFCRQRVTIYRFQDGAVIRQEVPRCYFQWGQAHTVRNQGLAPQRSFLLVIPRGQGQLQPGDRVLEGSGPQVTAQEWPRFIPAWVPGLGEVAYTRDFSWEGVPCHTEGGRK